MTREIKRYTCKDCGNPFYYAERSYRLKGEKGESRPERCERCSEEHGREKVKVKIPYFQFKRKTASSSVFNFSKSGYTCHGDRDLKGEVKQADWSGMKTSITPEDIKEKFYRKLRENQVIVVVGQTGSGKSTLIPRHLLETPEGYEDDFTEWITHQGQIIVTQPLTAATEFISATIAEKSGYGEVGKGQIIGYRHGSETGREGEKLDDWNLLGFATDGSLRNWIREGKIGQYSVIMVDEAHQRTLNIDSLLMFLKNELPKHLSLKGIIASATINTEEFVKTFKREGISVGLFKIPAAKRERKFIHYWGEENPIKDESGVEYCNCWLCKDSKDSTKRVAFWRTKGEPPKEFELAEVAASFALKILQETKEGSILIFLPGEAPIEETARKVRRQCSRNVDVITVYRRLGSERVKELLRDKSKPRRVIVATNIAETSHTLDDVIYIIDSGYIKESQWDPETQISTLPLKPHSQDGRKQRWGRAGRVKDGYIYNLYTEEQFKDSEEHTPPEITRSCLDDVFLALKASGIIMTEELPWVKKPNELNLKDEREKEIQERWEKEIKRAKTAIIERGLVNQEGLVNEKALEIFHIPRPSSDIDLLCLADELNCLPEAITTLFLMANREGEARTGANLYTRGLGLLLWDPTWTVRTKMKIWSLHQGLRAGCQDDLDFVIKLACCFWTAEEKGLAKEWADYYFVNYEVLEKVLRSVKDLLNNHYRREAVEEAREINLNFLEKVRIAMETAWSRKIVNLKPGKPITYPVEAKIKVGAVSQYCVGNWQEQKKTIVAAAVEEEAVVEGYPNRVPTASFIVLLPGHELTKSKVSFFVDQRFPVGSWVRVKEENGKTYIVAQEKLPPSIKVAYQKTLDPFEDYSRVYLRKKEERERLFDKSFLTGEELTMPTEGVCIGGKRAEQARVVRWIKKDGQPVAVLSPFAESEILSLSKKKGDFLGVKIHQVVRDPLGRGGWILAQTEEGFEIPIELSEMSLSPSGPGLEYIEGQTLTIQIKDFDEEGLPRLSNIDKVIEDLKNFKSEIFRKSKEDFPGYIVDISEEEENAVAVAIRENGVVHPFEIYKEYVPGSNISNLRIGDEAMIRFSLPRTAKDHIQASWLTKREVDNIHFLTEWEYDENKSEVFFPYCLGDDDFKSWSARPEAIDFVKRHSWRYCLNAQISTTTSWKEVYTSLKPEIRISGKVIETTKDQEGVNIQIEVITSRGKFQVITFMPRWELSWKIKKESSLEVITKELKKIENEIIDVCILKIDLESSPPKLQLSRKQAFKASAKISPYMGGRIFGTGGRNIKPLQEKYDFGIELPEGSQRVTVCSPLQKDLNAVCKDISARRFRGREIVDKWIME